LSRFLPCPCVVFRLALLAAVIAAFALAGCGRKGGLDPPPAASLTGDHAATGKSGSAPAMDREGRPVAAPVENRRILLDTLLN
jgi:predicted small lipoprotein YifL